MMPLDLEPNPKGNVVIVDDQAVTISRANREQYAQLPHYTCHFATCPEADRYRS
jgi:hypothetical protein